MDSSDKHMSSPLNTSCKTTPNRAFQSTPQSRLISIVFLILLCLFAGPASAKEVVPVYTYHEHPPFINRDDTGLSHQLIQMLNTHIGNNHQFQLQILPRQRLDTLLAGWTSGRCAKANNCTNKWLVAWVNPAWGFGKDPMRNFSWFRMFEDANSIISRADQPIDYQSPESLIGLNFGGMRGHHYVGIDNLIQQKKLARIDSNQERDNLIMLLKGRLDVTLLPSSTINYFLKNDVQIAEMSENIFVADRKQQIYSRYIMLPNQAVELKALIRKIDFQTPQWMKLLTHYGIDTNNMNNPGSN